MFMLEAMEGRALFSGQVVVTDTNGLISITGDTAANSIYITQVKGGHLKIAGAAGTTVNGQTAYTTAPVTQYVTIAMGAGNDYVNLSKLTLPYSVKVDGGAGNDTLEFHNSTFAATDVYGDAGNDTIAFASVTQTKFLQIFAGDGKDTTGLKALRARKGFSVNDTGTGGDTGFDSVSAAGQSWITTGNGNDTLSIKDSAFNAFDAKLRGGDDTAVVRRTTFATGSPIDGGTGTNDIDREIEVTYNFNTGEHGFVTTASSASVALEPYTEVNGATVQTLQAAGFTVTLSKLLDASSGFIPDTTYAVTSKTILATDLEMAGVAPSGSVYSGATPVDPNNGQLGNNNGSEYIILNGLKYPIAYGGDLAATNQNIAGFEFFRTAGGTTVKTSGDSKAYAVINANYAGSEDSSGGSDDPATFNFFSVAFTFTPVT